MSSARRSPGRPRSSVSSDEPASNGSSPFTSRTRPSAENSLWDVITPLFNTKELEPGRIYVYRDPNTTESIYKIGWTKRPIPKRMYEQQACCGFNPERIYVSEREIKNCGRLEALIGWDLGNRRMARSCPKTMEGHDEWFAVDKTTAIKTVKRWENFMDCEKPYDAEGNLSVIWKHLLQKRSPDTAGIRNLPKNAQLEKWAATLASPTYGDYACAYLSHADSEIRRFHGWKSESYWKLSVIFYGLWMHSVKRDAVSFYALVFVLVCASLTLLPKSGLGNK